MKKHAFKILTFIALLPSLAHSQAIVKGAGIVYTNGAPTHSVGLNTDAETAIDSTTGYWYEYSRDVPGWILAGFRVQKFPFSTAPTVAPGDKKSELQLNDVDSLYRWRGGQWRHLNKVVDGSITNEGILGVAAAGAASSLITSNTSTAVGVTVNVTGILGISEGVSSNGGSITLSANEIDGSITNEGLLGVGAGGATSSVLLSNTSTAAGVTVNVGGINAITETTSANGGSITITATEVDGSITNELQTIANSSTATTHTTTLSNSGGSTQFVEGTGIGLATTGTGLDGIVTITNTAPDQTVSITGAGINVVTGTYPTFTITGTEVDGLITNEGLLGVGAGSGTSAVLLTNSSTGVGVTVNAAGILAVSETTSANGGSITLTATEVDGSVSNELQTIANSSDATSHTATLSNSGGSIKLVEGSNITLTTSGTGLDGIITIASTGSGSDGNGFYGGNGGNGGDGTIPSVTKSTITNQQTFYRSTDDTGGFVPVRIEVNDGNEPDFLSLKHNFTSDSLLFSFGDAEFNIRSTTTLAIWANSNLGLIGDSIQISTVSNAFDNEATLLFVAPSGSIVKAEGLDPDIIRQNGAALDDVLKWNGTKWVPGAGGSSGGTDLTFTGAASPYSLNSSTGTDVTFSQGSGIVITRSSNDLSFAAVDISATNEAWTISGDAGDTEVISNQSVIFEGAGIVSTSYSAAANSLEISATEVDGSITNEGLLGVGAGGATSSVLLSNSSTAVGVTVNVGGINAITETTSANGGQITITATEVDGSVTNELQTVANTSNATSHTATLSNSGGSLQFVEGTGIGLSTTGTGLDGVLTITNSSPDQTVSITNGGGVVVTGTYPAFTLTATDASITNELQTIANTSNATSHTQTLSNSGGSTQFVEGANVTLTTTGTGLDGVVTIAAAATDLTFSGAGPYTLNSSTGTDVTFTQGSGVTITRSVNDLSFAAVDVSATNELQTVANTSNATSHTATLSNSGGSLQFVEGTGIGLATTGTGLDGVLTITNNSPDQTVALTGAGITAITGTYPNFTITSTEVDGSISNEGLLGVGAGGATSSVLLSNSSTAVGVTVNVAGINAITETTSANGGSITITATEVDGSTSNELQTIANASTATTHTATLSNSGGSLQLAEGAGITLTTTGTGLDGIVTIASTAGSQVANNGLSDNEAGGEIRLGNRYMNGSDGLFSFDRSININDFTLFVGDNTDSTLLSVNGNSDKVGIGTATPGQKLEVSGSGGVYTRVTTTGAVANSGIVFNNTADNQQTWAIYRQNDGDLAISVDATAQWPSGTLTDPFIIKPSPPNNSFYMDSAGKVQLSGTSPQRTLHVTGEVRVTDLVTDNPTVLVGADGDGDLSSITVGSGLNLTGTTLTATAGGAQTQVDDYSANATYTVPAGTIYLEVICVGAGGGGGSGRKRAAATLGSGGGGGGSGAVSFGFFKYTELGSPATITVVVGAGGAGGAAQAVNSTNGNAGAAGGVSNCDAAGTFFIRADGGGGGAGGTNAGAAGGAAPAFGDVNGGLGGASGGAAGLAGGNGTTKASAGGGSGGSVTAANVNNTGGAGGSAYYNIKLGGAGGAVAAAGGGGAAPGTGQLVGSGGGGGGSKTAAGGAAGAGGAGARGAGGGGGGAGTDAACNSGAGGAGGAGFVRIIAHF